MLNSLEYRKSNAVFVGLFLSRAVHKLNILIKCLFPPKETCIVYYASGGVFFAYISSWKI